MGHQLTDHINPQHVYFVFIDGVGLGSAESVINPLARFELPGFSRLAGGYPWTNEAPLIHEAGHVFRPVDANLDLDGLPQSGTGQATLFSGINCAEAAGRHYGPYPHSTSKPILKENSVFARLKRAGFDVDKLAFANAYPQRFFVHAWERKRWTVTTYMATRAGIDLHGADDLRAGLAISAGISNHRWREHLDPSMPEMTASEAADRFHRIGRSHAFALFEYYLTDKMGHEQDFGQAHAILNILDKFFGQLITRLDPTKDLLLITSDHGNLEDLSTRSHTRNPVPLVALGASARRFGSVESIQDVTPMVVEVMTK